MRDRNNNRVLSNGLVWCPGCKLYKEPDKFYTHNSTRRYSSWCRGCEKDNRKLRSSSFEYKILSAKIDHERREHIMTTNKTLTIDDIKELFDLQDGKCAKCQRGFSPILKYEIDHIVPASKGGDLSIENVQLLCKSCNCSKKDKTIKYRVDLRNIQTV
jgi:5-methylcytosine-specific restriction endonuclease McrA